MSINGKEVLIIDDTPEVRLLARRIVENSGMIAIEADSVGAALKILANRLPNIIMLDLWMPQKSGFEFLKARLLVPAIEAIPVIVVSASMEKESVFKAIGLGATDYAVKPLLASVLMKKIRKALSDTDFMSHKFSRSLAPKISCTVPALVSRPNETGFLVNSPFKINPATIIQLHSETLRELGLEDSTFMTEGNPSLRDASGCYFSRINVVGLKAPVTRILKKTGT